MDEGKIGVKAPAPEHRVRRISFETQPRVLGAHCIGVEVDDEAEDTQDRRRPESTVCWVRVVGADVVIVVECQWRLCVPMLIPSMLCVWYVWRSP